MMGSIAHSGLALNKQSLVLFDLLPLSPVFVYILGTLVEQDLQKYIKNIFVCTNKNYQKNDLKQKNEYHSEALLL